MRDVELVLPDGMLRVRYLEGTALGMTPGAPPRIDDPNGYRLRVDRAEVAVDLHTLNAMMSADRSKSGRAAPLASADFTTEAGLLVITGSKPLPFVLKLTASVDPQGQLTLTVADLKALGVQTSGVLEVLDLKLEELVDVKNERGIRIDGNVIHADPLQNMPPPGVDAEITGVSVEADGLVLRLGARGTTRPETPDSPTAKATAETPGGVENYVAYTGGTVNQGNLRMTDARLTLVDLDPSDPLRLDIDSIQDQISAGYTKIGANGEMKTYIPDADEVEITSTAPIVPSVGSNP